VPGRFSFALHSRLVGDHRLEECWQDVITRDDTRPPRSARPSSTYSCSITCCSACGVPQIVNRPRCAGAGVAALPRQSIGSWPTATMALIREHRPKAIDDVRRRSFGDESADAVESPQGCRTRNSLTNAPINHVPCCRPKQLVTAVAHPASRCGFRTAASGWCSCSSDGPPRAVARAICGGSVRRTSSINPHGSRAPARARRAIEHLRHLNRCARGPSPSPHRPASRRAIAATNRLSWPLYRNLLVTVSSSAFSASLRDSSQTRLHRFPRCRTTTVVCAALGRAPRGTPCLSTKRLAYLPGLHFAAAARRGCALTVESSSVRRLRRHGAHQPLRTSGGSPIISSFESRRLVSIDASALPYVNRHARAGETCLSVVRLSFRAESSRRNAEASRIESPAADAEAARRGRAPRAAGGPAVSAVDDPP